jgi:hypothetical protein
LSAGGSGEHPTAPIVGRFMSQTKNGPEVLSGRGKYTVLGAEYVYCFRPVGRIAWNSDLYTRSEIPHCEDERQKQPAEFDLLQYQIKALDKIICNMADVVDMTDELEDAKKKTDKDNDLAYRMKMQRQVGPTGRWIRS